MVRSAGGKYASDLLERGIVAIGWGDLKVNISQFKSPKELKQAVIDFWPNMKEGTVISSASQLWKFAHVIKIGDRVITYDSAARQYYVGEVIGEHEYRTNTIHDFNNIRTVKWNTVPISRDALSNQTKNTLGSTLTIFRIPDIAAQEIEALIFGKPVQVIKKTSPEDVNEEAALEQNIESIQMKANELIKDRVMALGWEDMQELVAGVLRAMGYKTRVSPSGSDRGKDIVASPDGLGFEQPRIVVEVKHRKGPMGSQEIRGFLGGRHKDDKGLYVSTGGFTKDAKYEAERATIPLTLIDIDDLMDILLENYDSMDVESKALIPLSRVYWPTN